MAREKDDARYEALAKAFDEMRVEQDAANRRVEELSARPNTNEPDSGMEQSLTRSNVGATRFERATSTSRT
jgi:hypothetical protein